MAERDPGDWMWSRALEFFEQAERMQRQLFRLSREYHQPVWEPPVDIFETETELWILAALPGVASDDMRVIMNGNVITVRGERAIAPFARSAKVHRLEIPFGRIERSIVLPDGRYEIGNRELSNGCLVLSLRKV